MEKGTEAKDKTPKSETEENQSPKAFYKADVAPPAGERDGKGGTLTAKGD